MAHAGSSMVNLNGAEVAKDASNDILMDNNFALIVKAIWIMWGHHINSA